MHAADPPPSSDGKTRDRDGTATPDQTTCNLPPTKKPLSFHMSFLALNIMVFIVSLDATILAVAIPVRHARSTFPLQPHDN